MPTEVSWLGLSYTSKADRKTTPLNPSNGNDQPESSFKKMTDAFFQPSVPLIYFRIIHADLSDSHLEHYRNFHPEARGRGQKLREQIVYLTSASSYPTFILELIRRPSVPEYHSINDPTIRVRVPSKLSCSQYPESIADISEKIATPVKVEAKVWFANERTYISYLSMGLLLSTISSGLLFGARDGTARYFAIAYAAV